MCFVLGLSLRFLVVRQEKVCYMLPGRSFDFATSPSVGDSSHSAFAISAHGVSSTQQEPSGSIYLVITAFPSPLRARDASAHACPFWFSSQSITGKVLAVGLLHAGADSTTSPPSDGGLGVRVIPGARYGWEPTAANVPGSCGIESLGARSKPWNPGIHYRRVLGILVCRIARNKS